MPPAVAAARAAGGGTADADDGGNGVGAGGADEAVTGGAAAGATAAAEDAGCAAAAAGAGRLRSWGDGGALACRSSPRGLMMKMRRGTMPTCGGVGGGGWVGSWFSRATHMMRSLDAIEVNACDPHRWLDAIEINACDPHRTPSPQALPQLPAPPVNDVAL